MTERPRLLLIGPSAGPLDGALAATADVDPVSPDAGEVARRLRAGGYAAVVAAPDVVAGLIDRVRRDELIISHIERGLAILDPLGVVQWANPVFRAAAAVEPVGRPLLDSLGSDRVSIENLESPVGSRVVPPGAPDDLADPLSPARRGAATALRVHRPDRADQPFLEIDVRPVFGPDGGVSGLTAVVRDVTAMVAQQQKLDALHTAGRELAGLDADQLTEMNVEARVELLKANLRRTIRDLLHYDTIEVRLLDRSTGELKPLLEDGMLPEAAQRVLYARRTDNGVTGFVAATGVSYLCRDTAHDPHYIAGAAGARSSMTIPLKFQDEVIGTLNVESPRADGFGPDDLQFTELFSKEVAAALHTLDLLSAQQFCTAGQSIESVNKEVALPLDEILTGASVLLERAGGAPEDADRLRRILTAARRVKDSIAQVGRDMTDAPAPGSQPLLGKRVLVVESDERIRRAAHLMLGRLGATVETAATGADGVALAADGRYDAIFQEVKPPDLGGYECYRRLKAASPGATIALTTGFGYDVAHSIVKARADGMRHVLFKPFRQDQVVRAVIEGDGASPSASAFEEIKLRV
ncbi:Transcriptional regulatory protein CusR [Gemmata obscuriglobus]|uniref:Transcriptional regulator n=1 Tax=Gemmata obscuriglobus TaxID=114 RepID=A0A2Z3H9N6_9BACT|nr:GAF domain-containing protein [Gemmata obscuriglobus]AWM41132.1 transcriptional regulator [Gemmata obscuriglobus]QEG25533.1 Transcriptional regulatory protein CusR [Gemmata obscuriglobus]VTR98869.1 sensor kinase : Response regulator with CheY-like receiver, AAA-type ATPase, and DNA-binding domains OS=Singulisphaera acidiphila (strain ATCC BAA-1392 / DSM 18658 / VKM B-2454 / MOB10) GN=Sinac_2610 PE=4 SV=1: PAS_4: GAF: Response_reg [Gemmata obscuriglobus UQM 2246]